MNIGDKVKIKECHKTPKLVGQIAKVISVSDPDKAEYPIVVELEEEMEFPHPMGKLLTTGPFYFREDELELADPAKDIPKAFQEA